MMVRTWSTRHWTLSLCIWFAGMGCQGAGDGTVDANGSVELQPVEVSGLDDFPESVRRQVLDQHARVQALARRPGVDSARLGEAYGILGQHLLAYELNESAQPALENAASLLPNELRWQYYLGHLYKREGELERAAERFRLAREARPDYEPARIYLADVYRDLGRAAEAREILERIVRADSDYAVGHLLLGHLASAAENPAEAIEHYETVLQLQPKASIVRHPLALAYRAQGNLAASREHLAERGQAPVRFPDPLMEELKRIRKGAGALVYEGNKMLEQRRYEDAAVLFERAAVEDSTNVSAHMNLAVAVAQLGEFERAKEALREVVRLEPFNARAHYNLGIVTLYSQGSAAASEALVHFRAAVEADSGMSAARVALANLYWSQRRCRDAVAHYRKYLAVRPDNVRARFQSAVCHVQLNEYAEARRLLEEGYRAFPDEPALLDALIRVLAASADASVRDGERALELAQRLAAEQRSVEALESLAMALAEVGRYGEAARYQQEVVRAAERGSPAPGVLEYLRDNLRRYERGEPCRSPWPATVFDQ